MGYELSQLPIALNDSSLTTQLTGIVNQILAAKKANQPTEALEAEVDRLVYALYGLTDEEIRLIDPAHAS